MSKKSSARVRSKPAPQARIKAKAKAKVPAKAKAKKLAPERLDPRVRRTRRLLRDALLALVRERGFDAISVQDLAERAEVNRATFYLHYRDKYDLLTQSMKDMLDELVSPQYLQGGAIGSVPRLGPDETPVEFVRWFEHAAAHPDMYHILLNSDGMVGFLTQIRRHIERLMQPWLEQRFGAHSAGLPLVLRSRFLSSALLGVLAWWLAERMPHPPGQMAAWLWQLTRPQLPPRRAPQSQR